MEDEDLFGPSKLVDKICDKEEEHGPHNWQRAKIWPDDEEPIEYWCDAR
jgi:hypothetical protein